MRGDADWIEWIECCYIAYSMGPGYYGTLVVTDSVVDVRGGLKLNNRGAAWTTSLRIDFVVESLLGARRLSPVRMMSAVLACGKHDIPEVVFSIRLSRAT